MVGLIIFWIGMYILLEIIAIDVLNQSTISYAIDLSLDDSVKEYLKIIGIYMLILLLSPLLSLWVSFHWIKAK